MYHSPAPTQVGVLLKTPLFTACPGKSSQGERIFGGSIGKNFLLCYVGQVHTLVLVGIADNG
jgi:hypothetical protein